jgi:hypothetical protein
MLAITSGDFVPTTVEFWVSLTCVQLLKTLTVSGDEEV